MADYYNCLLGSDRVHIKSLLINGAVLPAATICTLGNAKLIQDATISSSPGEDSDSGGSVSAAVWLETDDGEIFTTSPVAIGGSPTESDTAILQLRTTSKGFLAPILTTSQRDDISNPPEGLLIYNSTTSSFNYYNGAEWSEIGTGGSGESLWTQSEDGVYIDSSVSIGGLNSEADNAILELTSTTKGFLPPRMTEAQRDAISTPAAGLIVYNTDTENLDYRKSSAWSTLQEHWKLLHTEVLVSNASQIQVAGLDGDVDQAYKIIYHIIVNQPNEPDNMIYSFTINDVTANNSYSSAFSVVESTGVDTAFNEMHTQIKLDQNDTTGAFLAGEIHITHADSSVYRHMLIHGTTVDSDGAIIKSIQGSATWRNNLSNLTSIEFNTDITDSIASGSVVEVWVKNA